MQFMYYPIVDGCAFFVFHFSQSSIPHCLAIHVASTPLNMDYPHSYGSGTAAASELQHRLDLVSARICRCGTIGLAFAPENDLPTQDKAVATHSWICLGKKILDSQILHDVVTSS